MKFFIVKLLLICLLVLGMNSRATHKKSNTSSKTKTLLKAHMKTTLWVRPLLKTSRFYHSFANLAYCPGDIINQLSCPLCDKLIDSSFEVFRFFKHQVQGYTFTFIILFSINRNEAVLTFSGPRNPHHGFYSTLYSKGMDPFHGEDLEKANLLVENVYMDAYKGTFRTELLKATKDYIKKFGVEKESHKYTFVGHQFGGSLATIAAYDLMDKNIIKGDKKLISPVVYTYGQLRVGNAEFIEKVNSMFKVVRIIKTGDFYPRMPVCTWSPSLNKFRCEQNIDLSKVGAQNLRPELLNYIQNYYGKKGGLQAGQDAPYGSGISATQQNPSTNSFLEFSAEKKHKKDVGWSYSGNNPGYTVNNLGNPFDENGVTSDKGSVSYSQPLGAEVLYSNNFKRHNICAYYYGIPNCEKRLEPTFDATAGNEYFDQDLTDC
jgi:hypothetical protein